MKGPSRGGQRRPQRDWRERGGSGGVGVGRLREEAEQVRYGASEELPQSAGGARALWGMLFAPPRVLVLLVLLMPRGPARGPGPGARDAPCDDREAAFGWTGSFHHQGIVMMGGNVVEVSSTRNSWILLALVIPWGRFHAC